MIWTGLTWEALLPLTKTSRHRLHIQRLSTGQWRWEVWYSYRQGRVWHLADLPLDSGVSLTLRAAMTKAERALHAART